MIRLQALLCFLLLLLAETSRAQAVPPATSTGQAVVVLGRTEFPINEYFTISFTLRGAPLDRYSAFPDIEGFKKSGKLNTTTTRTVGGQSSIELTITQRYAAYQEGEFELPPFTITVNGNPIRSPGATLEVGPQQTATTPPATGTNPNNQPLQGIGLLDELFGKPKPDAYVEPKDHAFLALVADKSSVYVGEGVHVSMYFYLTPADQGLLDFYNFAGQLPGIMQQLQQRTAWEEHFEDQEITPETITVGGKSYLRYRLYETELYPLTAEALRFPIISLQMVKYKVAKDPTADPTDRLEGYKTYFTEPLIIAVKPLPPHPLRDQVAVGRYQLREAIDRTTFQVGQTFTYTFSVEGEGNLATLSAPTLRPQPGVELYGPDIQQDLTRQSGRVGGRKRFTYRLVPRQPGPLLLDSLLTLVYFNLATARYDTLRPQLVVSVQDAPQKAAFRPRPDDPFYTEALQAADNTLQPLDAYRDVRRYANIVLVLLLGLAGFGWWRGGRQGAA
ncbi:BatD family protein [Hymenobacter profundi]|uniref:BatD family protein n=1 Tax=Hymenobacter profundi TaxID=1982110 RepID=UPI001C56D2DD